MTEDSSARADLNELRELISQKIAFLLDNNARAVNVLRSEAKAWERIAEFFIDMADQALEIGSATADLALQTATRTGDILITEFGVDGVGDDGDGDDDDD